MYTNHFPRSQWGGLGAGPCFGFTWSVLIWSLTPSREGGGRGRGTEGEKMDRKKDILENSEKETTDRVIG